jgi:hypothetical protein
MPDVVFHVTVDKGNKDTSVCFEAAKGKNCNCKSAGAMAAFAGDEGESLGEKLGESEEHEEDEQ